MFRSRSYPDTGVYSLGNPGSDHRSPDGHPAMLVNVTALLVRPDRPLATVRSLGRVVGWLTVGAMLLLAIFPPLLLAQVLLLVPGQDGRTAQAFREAGITTMLAGSGWADGGHLLPTTQGVEYDRPPSAATRLFYTPIMPIGQPIPQQSEWLKRYLDAVAARHPQQDILLVAHSLAGVVARHTLVTYQPAAVRALVTIASPHLDTGMAQWEEWFQQMFSAEVVISREMSDMRMLLETLTGMRAADPSANLLRWLSHQPHPDIRYVSILRVGDTVLEPMLQDLNRVLNLRGRVETLVSTGGHALVAEDGTLIAALFSQRPP